MFLSQHGRCGRAIRSRFRTIRIRGIGSTVCLATSTAGTTASPGLFVPAIIAIHGTTGTTASSEPFVFSRTNSSGITATHTNSGSVRSLRFAAGNRNGIPRSPRKFRRVFGQRAAPHKQCVLPTYELPGYRRNNDAMGMDKVIGGLRWRDLMMQLIRLGKCRNITGHDLYCREVWIPSPRTTYMTQQVKPSPKPSNLGKHHRNKIGHPLGTKANDQFDIVTLSVTSSESPSTKPVAT